LGSLLGPASRIARLGPAVGCVIGYIVCGSVPTERDCFNLIGTQIGDTITEGDLALEPDTFVRYTLVRQKPMLRAAKTFFERGQRDPGCEWVPARDAFYECAGEVAQQRAAR
jgi:hypothetical protein